MEKKRSLFDIQLNAIYDDEENPTKKDCEFILHDFRVSLNNSFISKETAEKTLHTLKDTPIVARYYDESDIGEGDDALGDHEAYLGELRGSGDPYVELRTVPIGVFTEPAYIKTIEDENGEEIEVVAGKGVLWATRFPNPIGLLQEWVNEGIDVVSSMEILYDSYKVEDGVEEILSYVYDGHCVLNSENRGEHDKVVPAYDVSKLTRLVAQALHTKNEQKEGEKMGDMFKKVFELSHNDIRTQLYRVLDAELDNNQYSWIRDVYDSNFVVEIDTVTEENFETKVFKYDYSKENDQISIDFDSKKEVMKKTEWVELEEVQNLQAQLETKEEEVKTLQSQKEEVENEKGQVEKQFNDASEKLTKLSQKVEDLQEIEKQYNQEQYEKNLEEKQELYSAKFSAIGAKEKYESDEVQELVEQSISDENATYKLNSMIVELIAEQEEKEDDKSYVQHSSKRENLVPNDDDFESRYGI